MAGESKFRLRLKAGGDIDRQSNFILTALNAVITNSKDEFRQKIYILPSRE
jgi:hypothetical protein